MNKQELINVLKEIIPDVDLDANHKLVTNGIISSLSFVMIFSAISDHYNVEIPFEEMIPENFDSLDAMLELITRLKK